MYLQNFFHLFGIFSKAQKNYQVGHKNDNLQVIKADETSTGNNLSKKVVRLQGGRSSIAA